MNHHDIPQRRERRASNPLVPILLMVALLACLGLVQSNDSEQHVGGQAATVSVASAAPRSN